MRTARCPYCDSLRWWTARQRPTGRIRVFVIGFAVDRNRAAARMRRVDRAQKACAFTGSKEGRGPSQRGLPSDLSLLGDLEQTYLTTHRRRLLHHRGGPGFEGPDPGEAESAGSEYHELQGAHADYVGDVVVTASRRASPTANWRLSSPTTLRSAALCPGDGFRLDLRGTVADPGREPCLAPA